MESNETGLIKALDVLKVHRRYIYIIAIIICVFFIRECSHSINENELIKNIATYNDSARHYKNKYGTVVAYNQTLQFNTDKQLKLYLSNNDTLKYMLSKFKKITDVSIIKERVFVHDTIAIQYASNNSIINCNFKPFRVRRDCTDYLFSGTIYETKFTIDTIFIPNKQSIVVGSKRINLFRRENRIEVTNSNPRIITTNVGDYTIKEKPKRIGIGFSVGYGFSLHQNQVFVSPFLGVSANYNLINF